MKRRIAATLMATGLGLAMFAGTAQAAGHEPPPPNCIGKTVSGHAKLGVTPANAVAAAAKGFCQEGEPSPHDES